MIWFRHADPAFAFFWESSVQPAARWHRDGEGPVQYLADTPQGAWAELLRHEGIVDADDVADLRRSLWAVDVPAAEVDGATTPRLAERSLVGGLDSYDACQREAGRLRTDGETSLRSRTAALVDGGATGNQTSGGLRQGTPRDGGVLVLFGARPEIEA